MTCPKCQFENPEGAKFCAKCGALLAQSIQPQQLPQPQAPPPPTETASPTPPPPKPTAPVIPGKPEATAPPTIHPALPSKTAKKKILLFAGVGLFFLIVLYGGGFLFIKVYRGKAPEAGRESISTLPTEKLGGLIPFETPKTQVSSEFSKEDLSKLGVVSPPEGASVQFTYKGIDFMRSPQRSFSEHEIWLLKYFLDLTPQKLLDPPPKAIVTYEKGELKLGSIGFNPAVAYASGPYVFFSEKSFNPKGITGLVPVDSSIDAVFSIFEHELVHVAQFFAVPDSAKQRVINGEIASRDKLYYSELLPNFIEVTGWKNTNPGEKWLIWELPEDEESQKTTTYGKTNPVEDMADTLAGCVLTDFEKFSKARVEWCKEWLGAGITGIENNKLPIYPDSKLVKAMFGRISDEEIEERYKQEFPLVDIQTWGVDEINQIENVKNFFETELQQRGWQGSFSKEITKYDVIVYTGDFENQYRKINVQLKTYDSSDKYVSAPEGTTIAIISGYKIK